MWFQVQEALNKSMTRVITGIANLLPGLAALVLAVAISGLVAWIAGLVIRRFLRRVDFDTKLAGTGTGLAEISPGGSPAALVARLVSWVIVFFGLTIGVAAFDSTLTSRLVGQFFAYLPNLIAALLLILIGNLFARYFARSVLIGAVNMNVQYPRLLSAGVKWLILVFTAAMALNHLGIGGEIVSVAFAILFGGITLTLSLAVGLGVRNFVSRSLKQRTSREVTQEEEPFHHS